MLDEIKGNNTAVFQGKRENEITPKDCRAFVFFTRSSQSQTKWLTPPSRATKRHWFIGDVCFCCAAEKRSSLRIQSNLIKTITAKKIIHCDFIFSVKMGPSLWTMKPYETDRLKVRTSPSPGNAGLERQWPAQCILSLVCWELRAVAFQHHGQQQGAKWRVRVLLKRRTYICAYIHSNFSL